MAETANRAERVYAGSPLGLACILTLVLLAVRRFTRTEAAVEGETMWLTAGWAVTALLLGLHHGIARSRSGFCFRIQLVDAAAILIVLGQLVSTAKVFVEHGDRRAAVNLCIEWVGWLLAWFCLRLLMQQTWFRRLAVSQFVCLAAALSAFGIWQHHVFYPQEATRYVQNAAAIDAAEQTGVSTEASRQAKQAFLSGGVPTHPVERMLFERRLLDSTEPFGPFALANTLAGFLVAATILLASRLVFPERRDESDARGRFRQALDWLAIGVTSVLVLYCLVLTKSRSAWIGATAGLGLLFFLRRSQQRMAKLAIRGGLVLAAISLVGVVGIATGAIDREVLLEAPRSIQFRLMYWIGSLRMLVTRPLFGTGPGNFRQHYLPFKMPESSEAIADPHNIFLDAWATGGILSLIGIAVLLVATIRLLRIGPRSDSAAPAPRFEQPVRVPGSMRIVISVGIAFPVSLIVMRWWYFYAEIDTSEQIILATAAVAMLAWSGLALSNRDPCRILPSVAAAAALAWLVHLLAAGGFQMPAPMQDIALLIIAAGSSGGLAAAATTSGRAWFRWPLLAVPAAILAFSLLQSDVVYRSERLRLDGQRYQAEGNLRLAERQLQAAIETDPWNVKSRQQMAVLLTYGLDRRSSQAPQDGSTGDRANFDREFNELTETIAAFVEADRQYAGGYRAGSAAYWMRYQIFKERSALTKAIENQRLCVERNPTDAGIRVDLAEMYEAAGNHSAAAAEAAEALRLEAINQEWNHVDRFLPEASKNSMLRISASSSE